MSFTRVNLTGWAVGDQLTSAQQNALDIDHANALDKTTAGDNIAGTVGFTGSGKISANLAGCVSITASFAVAAAASAAIQATVANAIQPTVATAISSNVARGIAAITPSGISSEAVGGITLNGGTSDYITYQQTRSRTLPIPGHDVAGVAVAGVAGTEAANYIMSGASQPQIFDGAFVTAAVNTANSNQIPYYMPLRWLHNGATLNSAVLYLRPNTGHAALPQSMPAFGIWRTDMTSSVPFGAGTVALLSTGGGIAIDPTATLGAYNGTTHSWTYTANQNNIIDTSKYIYHAVIWDEGGTNAVSGGSYFGLQVTMVNISSSAPG